MFEQPLLSDHIQTINNFNHFITICLMFGIMLSAIVLKYGSNNTRLSIPLDIRGILLIGLIIRIPLLFQAYWYDESFTSAFVSVPWLDLMTAIRGDVHPYGYYILVKMFTEILGHNQIVMRLPALLSGLGLIYVMYQIAKEQHSESIARWTGLIIAILPACIYYSTEARYPMLLALCLAVAYKSFNTGNVYKKHYNYRNVFMFSVSLTLASLLHINAWITVVLFCIAWLIRYRSIIPSIAPAIAVLSWLPVAMAQSSDVSNGFWLQQSPVWLHVIEMTVSIKSIDVYLSFFIFLTAYAIIGISVLSWRKNANFIWLSMAVLPPFILWLVGILWHPIYLPRTLLFSAILLVLPLAWYIDRKANLILVIMGLTACLLGIVSIYSIPRDAKLESIISNCETPIIYTTNTQTAILAKHYTDADIWLYTHGNSTAQYLPLSAQAVVFDAITDDPQGYCVVSQVSSYNTPQEMIHITQLSLRAEHVERYPVENSRSYYLIMRMKP